MDVVVMAVAVIVPIAMPVPVAVSRLRIAAGWPMRRKLSTHPNHLP